MPTRAGKHTNRLIHETSPYLLQHAHNPVDWYSWGPEAFELARRLNKPIFLSIGYSTCYWCHVMERQCFESEEIAAELNERFVPIKVDREERPDVDQLYMLALQVLTHSGGWPMSMFLTPGLLPFYGGTYFPPSDMHGRPGFVTVLRALESAYRERPGDVQATASQLVSILRDLSGPQAPKAAVTIDVGFIDSLIDRSASDYDAENGGFGSAAKFPRQTLLELLLMARGSAIADCRLPNADCSADDPRVKMALHTLDAIAEGGIHDHLSGAFHRYSTDERWLVPHFEIMLYDNAMLARLYTEAFRQSGRTRYARTARDICDFVLREMTSPQGGFYTAFDAETDAQEGQTHLWTRDEIDRVLGGGKDGGGDADLFRAVYGVDLGANFEGRNILYLPEPLAKRAAALGLTEEQLDARLAPLREKLYEVRQKRKQPALDTKIITSWNGLMIRALAYAGRVLSEPRYTAAAQKAAQFLLDHHLEGDGTLRHTPPKAESFLDDYAFLIQALLELGRTSEAENLADQMIGRFSDPAGGFFFTPAGASDLLLRQKTATDSPLPSGNAVAAMVLQQLGRPTLARETISAFASHLDESAEAASSLVQAALLCVRQHGAIAVCPGQSTGAPAMHRSALEVISVASTWSSASELNLRFSIADGYHLNAHDAGQGLIPTVVVVVGESAQIDYPQGQEQAFPFVAEPLRVYQGVITIVVRLARPITSSRSLLLRLSYQPCSDEACLPAVRRELHVQAPGRSGA